MRPDLVDVQILVGALGLALVAVAAWQRLGLWAALLVVGIALMAFGFFAIAKLARHH